MRVFVFQWILNQTGNDTELTLRPNTYSLNIVQPQPDGPVEPAKYAYTYGVQVVLFSEKSSVDYYHVDIRCCERMV